MKVRVIKPFAAKGGQVTAGTILNVPDELLPKLAGLVEVVEWPPAHRAWLVGDELRTTGVVPSLRAAIIGLTADAPELQTTLLAEHCWPHTLH